MRVTYAYRLVVGRVAKEGGWPERPLRYHETSLLTADGYGETISRQFRMISRAALFA